MSEPDDVIEVLEESVPWMIERPQRHYDQLLGEWNEEVNDVHPIIEAPQEG